MTQAKSKWDTGAAAWRRFCKDHPELGLVGTAHSWVNFHRKHGDYLQELDIVRRSPARNTAIVDTERFAPIVFDLLTLGAPHQARCSDTARAAASTP